MRSARDFLNSDSSGAERPPMVPLGGHPPAAAPAAPSTSPESVEASATESASSQASEAASGEPQSAPADALPEAGGQSVGLDDLLEVWPDLLEELLESDREAWNAVSSVQPLELRGEVLTVGLASRSDLDAFKASGAAPLREAIVGALGISVKYMPKSLPAGAPAPAAARESAEQPPQEPSPASEPSPAPSASESGSDLRPSQPRVSASEPLPPEGSAADTSPAEEPGYEPEPPEEEREPDPVDDPGPGPEPEPEPEPAAGADAEAAAAPRPEPAPTPERKPRSTEPPGFTRYGEAVVREVLGARFVEERPLPADLER